MTCKPARLSLCQWDQRYEELYASAPPPYPYGGPLCTHAEDGDQRLTKLLFDNSEAALRLWNFLLSEEDRLQSARDRGKKLVGAMKDLGTVPVMAYALPEVVAFYPDGAWWIPCVMELSAGLLSIADRMGIDETFCPVRAMLGAFETQAHFPIPDLLICSVGATCDDFSAIAQRLAGMGHPILWWEIPHRRFPEAGEEAVTLPGGLQAPRSQVEVVRTELERIKSAFKGLAGVPLTDEMLELSITKTNEVRRLLDRLRYYAYTATPCPLPALEMLIAEMLAIHFCSDQDECVRVLEQLVEEVRSRVIEGTGVLPEDNVRVFWVNPVADLRAMNLLEDCGGRLCGTEFLFCHALEPIPEDLPPMEALACSALADPMVGSAADRAARILAEIKRFGAEAVAISRIPGASHCATEGTIIRDYLQASMTLPILEIEIPPICDGMAASIKNRLRALVETARSQR
ncbi:MAG: 2-hydroxyacyl-CoA dehydratase [Planctomycetes bacterium]|nr:2-hydroxyacyl-CoA dehydratase [Planctomycetota bacterium]